MLDDKKDDLSIDYILTVLRVIFISWYKEITWIYCLNKMVALSILYMLRNSNTNPTHIVFVRNKGCYQIQPCGLHSLIYSLVDKIFIIQIIHQFDPQYILKTYQIVLEVKKVDQSSKYPCK